MNLLTNLLYWISTGMLIPVIVLLLISLVASLLILGSFFGSLMDRLKRMAGVKATLERLREESSSLVLEELATAGGAFVSRVKLLQDCDWHPIHGEKIVADFELEMHRELERARVLTRVGPMLGLMGTLIPMGPALVGLAQGDIASMALNMQVAFSTTVLGIFVGAVGYVTQLVKQRWIAEDTGNLRYLVDLSPELKGRS